MNPKAVPKITKDAGAALVVDGDNGMGQIACDFAMRTAIERARSTGFADRERCTPRPLLV